MTVTAVIREQTHTATMNSDGAPVLTYREAYLLKDDSGSWVGVQKARLNFTTQTGIQIGSAYTDYIFAGCVSITPTRLQTRAPWQRWRVDVEYTTSAPKIDDQDPSKRRVIRDVSDTDQQRFIIRDRNNRSIVDTAGSTPDGGVPVNVKLTSYNFERNVDWASYNLNSIGEYSGRLNADTFLGKEPGSLLLAYRARENWEGGDKYHFATETFNMIYDPLGWRPKFANAGLYRIDRRIPNAPKRTRITIDGRPVIEPEPLTPDGQVVGFSRRPQDCIFVTVDYHEEIPFSQFNLPTN